MAILDQHQQFMILPTNVPHIQCLVVYEGRILRIEIGTVTSTLLLRSLRGLYSSTDVCHFKLVQRSSLIMPLPHNLEFSVQYIELDT